jgi:hypothetical protein
MSLSAPCVGAYFFLRSAMGTGSSRDSTAIRKMTNRKVERCHSKNAAGRSSMSEGFGEGGRIMNEKEFCFVSWSKESSAYALPSR